MLEAAAQMLREIRDGRDIPAPSALLSRIKPEDAALRLPGEPYSLLTYTAHTVFWQDIWLAQLRGGRRPSIIEDWRVPEPEEWPEIRQRLLDGLGEAIAIAEGREPHQAKAQEAAVSLLAHIGIHLSYHIGQMKMLKRASAAAKKANR